MRSPGFCAGCPHNRSTPVPEGSRALAGIGCHWMATLVNPQQTATASHMGGEGAMWLGQEPFTNEEHVFANIGDGTYAHSGSLAIRQAIAADVPITYKILFNGFVSMTGGQPIEGGMTPTQILAELVAEGVKKLALVVDDLDRYAGVQLPPNVTLRHRDAMDATQREFREYKGVSVILYDQPCATERRRLRKRGKWADPAIRTFHQSRRLRRLRRLRARLQLHGDRTARDGIRAQAAHQSIELQQGLLLRRGILPELRDRSWRTPAQARGDSALEPVPAAGP